MHAFFVRNLGAKKSQTPKNPKHSFVIFGAKISFEKCECKALMKWTKDPKAQKRPMA